jgi:transcriptional regulator with XRE-family HTH domain
MPELASPSVRRRRLAAELRRLREERNLTGEDVATALGWSASKLSRIELARIGIKAADLTRLLDEYGVPDEHKEQLLRLIERRRSRGWWDAFKDSLPEKFATYIILESEAESISAWSPELIPGLLQTQDYARAAIDAHMSAISTIPRSEIEGRVQTRMRRQRILTNQPATELVSVLDQSVLLRHVHSARIMREQLAHLIEMSELSNVTLRVLPLNGAHPLGIGGFVLLRFPAIPDIGPVSDIVYIEELSGNALYIDDDSETHQYQLGFGCLVAESLDEAKSRDLIVKTIRDAWSN